jgi:hypothetical protein
LAKNQYTIKKSIDVIPSGGGEGIMNFLGVTKGNFNSPSHGLASVVKNNSQTIGYL